MKIIKPGDPEFEKGPSPFAHTPGKQPHPVASKEVTAATLFLLRALANSEPGIAVHLVTGGTILIGTNDRHVVEIPFGSQVGF